MRLASFVATTLLFLSQLPLSANAQFYNPKEYDRGSGFSTILKSDLNNDGKPDVVGFSFTKTAVIAALGDGTGGFLNFKSTPVTNLNNPNNLAVGDFNGDGFPDVVVSGSDPITGAAAIGVMLGNGDGTFQATTVYRGSISGSFYSGAAGDFTANGKIDVAVQGQNNITVFPGKGDGTFGAPISTTNGGGLTECLAAADFNGDGKLDLTTGTHVLLGKGNGRFQAPITVPAGNCGVAVADLNHDGILDLVTGSLNFEQVSVHLGNGTGKFDRGTTYQTGHTAGSAIQVADFNGDGSPDLAVLNGGDSDVTILLNHGDGTFTVGKTWNVGPDDRFNGLIAGEFSQNNKADLVVAPYPGVLGVILGNGDGTFQTELSQSDQLLKINIFQTHIGADVNNDHKQDLVFSNEVSLGNGNGSFREAIPFPKGCYATTVGDFNDDGKLDIAGPAYNGSNSVGVVVCLGKGNGSFGNPVVYDQGIQHNLVLAGDFNNDGKLDLAASDQGGISILLGNGNGSFGSGIPTALNATFPNFVLGDFNNDGKLDVAAITGSTVSVLLGKGNGTFSAPVATSISANQIYAADMNHDGKLDLVALNATTASIWLGNGDGTFTNSASKLVHSRGYAVVDDFNLDGNLDVAVDSPPYRVILLAGDGKGGFKSETNYLGGNGNCCLVGGDFNGDNRPDLAVPASGVRNNDHRLIVFLNILK
jgi:FG-GAP-like repeat